jgi:SNF2 family DNA or RNA helicase
MLLYTNRQPALAGMLADEQRSIIFSFWKTTLDIVAQLFDAQAMPYCRIHGQIPASKRNKILSNFEKLDEVRILLITLGTGAVG